MQHQIGKNTETNNVKLKLIGYSNEMDNQTESDLGNYLCTRSKMFSCIEQL